MAVYTKITKVYEELDKHIYTISNNGNVIDCIAVLIPSQQLIEIYRDMSFNECLYKYIVFDDERSLNPYCDSPYARLYGRAMHKLIYALQKRVFPLSLDKCS